MKTRNARSLSSVFLRFHFHRHWKKESAHAYSSYPTLTATVYLSNFFTILFEFLDFRLKVNSRCRNRLRDLSLDVVDWRGPFSARFKRGWDGGNRRIQTPWRGRKRCRLLNNFDYKPLALSYCRYFSALSPNLVIDNDKNKCQWKCLQANIIFFLPLLSPSLLPFASLDFWLVLATKVPDSAIPGQFVAELEVTARGGRFELTT